MWILVSWPEWNPCCIWKRILNPWSTRRSLVFGTSWLNGSFLEGCCLHYRIRTVLAEVASQGKMSVLSIILMTWLSPPPPKHGKGGASKVFRGESLSSDECQRRLCEEATFEYKDLKEVKSHLDTWDHWLLGGKLSPWQPAWAAPLSIAEL